MVMAMLGPALAVNWTMEYAAHVTTAWPLPGSHLARASCVKRSTTRNKRTWPRGKTRTWQAGDEVRVRGYGAGVVKLASGERVVVTSPDGQTAFPYKDGRSGSSRLPPTIELADVKHVFVKASPGE
jgi:hypothetical protein